MALGKPQWIYFKNSTQLLVMVMPLGEMEKERDLGPQR
jgi:hypothetical protein